MNQKIKDRKIKYLQKLVDEALASPGSTKSIEEIKEMAKKRANAMRLLSIKDT